MITETNDGTDTGTRIGEWQNENQMRDVETPPPKQFDFALYWNSRIVPLLDDKEVTFSLHFGLNIYDEDYESSDPPWILGLGREYGQRAEQRTLPWYQPEGLPHFIAPFCWALGKKLYPDLKWAFFTSDEHSVVVGLSNDGDRLEWVMDILNFSDLSAEESLAAVREGEASLHELLIPYASTFYDDPDEYIGFWSEWVEEIKQRQSI